MTMEGQHSISFGQVTNKLRQTCSLEIVEVQFIFVAD